MGEGARRKARRRKKRVINVRDGEGVIVVEPCLIRVRGVRGLGRRIDLEIITEAGKVKKIERDIDGAPPEVV